MGNTIIEQVFLRNIITTVWIIGMLIFVFFLVRWAVRESSIPKWSYIVYAIVTLIVVIVLCTGLFNIYLDIKEETYVTYQGDYIERGGSHRELKTVVVYDTEGNEIRLLRTGKSEEGEFVGTVVYGKRSKIIVEYSGTPKS